MKFKRKLTKSAKDAIILCEGFNFNQYKIKLKFTTKWNDRKVSVIVTYFHSSNKLFVICGLV